MAGTLEGHNKADTRDFISSAHLEYAFDTSRLTCLDCFLDKNSTNEAGDEMHDMGPQKEPDCV